MRKNGLRDLPGYSCFGNKGATEPLELSQPPAPGMSPQENPTDLGIPASPQPLEAKTQVSGLPSHPHPGTPGCLAPQNTGSQEAKTPPIPLGCSGL